MDSWSIWFRFLMTVLATWRVAHLVAREDGPLDLVVRARARAGDGVVGRLMDCPYCLSLWLAVPWAFWIANHPVEWIAAWLAISGGASLLERLSDRGAGEPRPTGE
jgi:hypothetical protein